MAGVASRRPPRAVEGGPPGHTGLALGPGPPPAPWAGPCWWPSPGEAASLTVGSSPCLGGPHSCSESGGSAGMRSRQPGRCGSQAQADPRTGEPGACPSLLPPLTRLARLWGWRPTLPSGPQPGWGPRDLEGPRRPHCPGHPQPPAGICPDSLTSEPGVCTGPTGSGPGSDTTCLHPHSGVRPLPGGAPGQQMGDHEQVPQPLGSSLRTGGQRLHPPSSGRGTGCQPLTGCALSPRLCSGHRARAAGPCAGQGGPGCGPSYRRGPHDGVGGWLRTGSSSWAWQWRQG